MYSPPFLEQGTGRKIFPSSHRRKFTLAPFTHPYLILFYYIILGGFLMHRLDKLLCNSGRWTRKEAKALLNQGRVSVNGLRVTDGNLKFPVTCAIAVAGEQLESSLPLWIMLHKPQGCVSAREDKLHDTVMDLLPPHYQKRGLFPVGRLDKDTEGLLLLTEDGETAHNLLSPTKHVAKRYYLEVDGQLSQHHIDTVASGMTLGDGFQCMPGKLEILPESHQGYITLTQGKYHQIKRMMSKLGTPVTYLKRLSMGNITLDPDLTLGQWRVLTLEEIVTLSQ